MSTAKVLWIEDNADNDLYHLTSPVYIDGQFHLDIASNASEGFFYLNQRGYDVIIVDCPFRPTDASSRPRSIAVRVVPWPTAFARATESFRSPPSLRSRYSRDSPPSIKRCLPCSVCSWREKNASSSRTVFCGRPCWWADSRGRWSGSRNAVRGRVVRWTVWSRSQRHCWSFGPWSISRRFAH